MRPCRDTMRRFNISRCVSSEKIATGMLVIATRRAMPSAKAVFPIDGRAARIVGLPGGKPAESRSSNRKPVEHVRSCIENAQNDYLLTIQGASELGDSLRDRCVRDGDRRNLMSRNDQLPVILPQHSGRSGSEDRSHPPPRA